MYVMIPNKFTFIYDELAALYDESAFAKIAAVIKKMHGLMRLLIK